MNEAVSHHLTMFLKSATEYVLDTDKIYINFLQQTDDYDYKGWGQCTTIDNSLLVE